MFDIRVEEALPCATVVLGAVAIACLVVIPGAMFLWGLL